MRCLLSLLLKDVLFCSTEKMKWESEHSLYSSKTSTSSETPDDGNTEYSTTCCY